MKIAFAGFGAFSKKRLESACKALSLNAEIVIYDKDVKVIETANPLHYSGFKSAIDLGKLKISFVSSLEKFSLCSPFDVVFIEVPNSEHLPTLKVLSHTSKVFFIEKPASTNSVLTQSILELGKSQKLNIWIGSNLVFFPPVLKIMEMITKDERLKNLEQISASIGHDGKATKGRWNEKLEISGGGTLIDNGIHLINMIDNLGIEMQCPQVESVSFLHENLENEITVNLNSKTKPLIKIHSSWKKQNGYCQIGVMSSSHILICDAFDGHVRIGAKSLCNLGPQGMIEPLRAFHDSQFIEFSELIPIDSLAKSIDLETARFIDACRNGTLNSNLSSAVRQMKIIDSIYCEIRGAREQGIPSEY